MFHYFLNRDVYAQKDTNEDIQNNTLITIDWDKEKNKIGPLNRSCKKKWEETSILKTVF